MFCERHGQPILFEQHPVDQTGQPAIRNRLHQLERGCGTVRVEQLAVGLAIPVRAIVAALEVGLAISSEWMFEQELANGALHRVLTEWQLPAMDLWAAYPGGRMPSAKARAFIAYVEKLQSAR